MTAIAAAHFLYRARCEGLYMARREGTTEPMRVIA